MNKKLLAIFALVVLCGVLCVGTVNAVKDVQEVKEVKDANEIKEVKDANEIKEVKDVNDDLDTTVYADEYHETGKIKASDYGADYIYDDRSNYNEPPTSVKVKTEEVKDYKAKKVKLSKKTTVKVTCPSITTTKQLKKYLDLKSNMDMASGEMGGYVRPSKMHMAINTLLK